MKTRYFQHLNPNDVDFQKVTELSYIDNSDPEFVLYFFKDGSKCNVNFIGALNDTNVFMYKEFAEVSNPGNAWKFKKVVPTQETKSQVGKDGILYETVDPYTALSKKSIAPHFEIISTPTIVPISNEEIEENLKDEIAMTQNGNEQFDFQAALSNSDNNIVNNDINVQPVIGDIKNNSTLVQRENMHIIELNENKIKELINNNADIQFTFNGEDYNMPIKDFFNNAVVSPSEKIIEKEVVKEVVKEISLDEHIDINLSDEQKGLIDNMIDMSQKESCDIEMEITLSLPPVSVYNLIKSVYPTGMAKGFVNIIADRMQIKELKTAVASGLLGYYDGDVETATEDNVQKVDNAFLENNDETKLSKKGSAKKLINKKKQ